MLALSSPYIDIVNNHELLRALALYAQRLSYFQEAEFKVKSNIQVSHKL